MFPNHHRNNSGPPPQGPNAAVPAAASAAAAAAAAAFARSNLAANPGAQGGAAGMGVPGTAPLGPRAPMAQATLPYQGYGPFGPQGGPWMGAPGNPLQPSQGPAAFAPAAPLWMGAARNCAQGKSKKNQYETTSDQCLECLLFKTDLYYLSCTHYPLCADCMRFVSLRTPGALNCPLCKVQVTVVRKVFRIKKVKKD